MLRIVVFIIIIAVFAAVVIQFQDKAGVSIAELHSNPQNYDGKLVVVAGTVQNNIAIFGVGGYFLENKSQNILVITDKGVPPKGEYITIEGIFKQVISVNTFSNLVIFQNVNIDFEKLVMRRTLL